MDDDTRRRFHIEAGAIRRPYTDAVRLLLLTGVRRDMVLGMRRSELEDIGGREPRWAIPGGFAGRSKSGRPHVVPLSPQALAVIEPRLEVVHSGIEKALAMKAAPQPHGPHLRCRRQGFPGKIDFRITDPRHLVDG